VEGFYSYDYHGRVFLADGKTPAPDVKVLATAEPRWGWLPFTRDDPWRAIAVADSYGNINGYAKGAWSSPILIGFVLPRPQASQFKKLWFWLQDDRRRRWVCFAAVPVVHATKWQSKDLPNRTAYDLLIVLPEWYKGKSSI
jgi:hypothetical protein